MKRKQKLAILAQKPWPTKSSEIGISDVTLKAHMIFEFRQLKEGLYIIMYEWQKYEVKIKTCVFGQKTVCYNPQIERNRHFRP